MQLPFDGVPPSLLSDGFDARYARQVAYEERALVGGEWYTSATGDYSKNSILNGTLDSVAKYLESSTADNPRRVSNFLAKRIGQLLETAKEPVIFLDMGAEFGITAHWLAILFANAIDDSSLAIGVTNLSPSLDEHDSFIEDHADLLSAFELRRKAAGRVQAITSSASKLPGESITLKNGTEIGLKGNVSLAHECSAITYWSQTPGIDIWRIGHLISPQGIYMVDEDGCRYPYFNQSREIDNVEIRKREIMTAQCELGVLGLKRATHVEDGDYFGLPLSYRVFKGPEALPVEV